MGKERIVLNEARDEDGSWIPQVISRHDKELTPDPKIKGGPMVG